MASVVARTVRRWPLARVAVVTEGAVALLFLAAWAVLTAADGVWVSAPLLVLWPVLLQIGFIFVGGQAGRLLDVQQLKVGFPRIVLGFALGFLAGGLAGAPLLALLGSTGDLLLIAVAAQVLFLVMLAVASRRFGERLARVDDVPLGLPRPPRRQLLSSRFVLLLIGYQVLSAAGTYMVEFLLFDRAASRYHDAASLASFLSKFTAVLNLVDIVFLALLAGALLRRFGLRLGIAANPALVAALGAAMLVAATVSGSGALALFVLVGAARIVDISLTDGMTRTSINTAFQLLPVEERLAVQATVEGVGVPVAIGATGVLLFVLRASDVSVSVIVAVTLAVCLVWTLSAVLLYRDYARALMGAIRRRLLSDVVLDPGHVGTAESLRRLIASNDLRDVRLGLDLLPGTWSPVAQTELSRLADDPRADVRIEALARLASDGDAVARSRLGSELPTLSASRDSADRLIAARALTAPSGVDRRPLAALVHDTDPAVRVEALGAVGAADPELVADVVAALDDPAAIGAAVPALGRLGDCGPAGACSHARGRLRARSRVHAASCPHCPGPQLPIGSRPASARPSTTLIASSVSPFSRRWELPA